jgi:hypothetical protein
VFVLENGDPFDFLNKFHGDIRNETREKVGVKYFTWSEWYGSLIDFTRGILKRTPKKDYSRYLFLNRLIEFNKLLLLLHELSVIGYYHSTIRELRYLFESALKSYYLDFNTSYSLDKKIKKAGKFRFKNLVNKMVLEDDEKYKIKQIYKTLSGYVHPSTEEILSSYNDISYRVTYAFNEELFNLCVLSTNEVMDVVLFLALKGFNFLVSEMKQDKMLLKWLKSCNCELALTALLAGKEQPRDLF